MRNSLFCLGVAPETRREAGKGDIATGHVIECSSASIVCYWPILLKKSDVVPAAEKCAREIEMSNHRKSIQTQISRSSAGK